MPKPVSLTPDALAIPTPVPAAATPPRTLKKMEAKPEPVKTLPLQIRLPAAEVKAIKIATAEGDFKTISDFMLTCFHAYMKTRKHA